MVGNLNVENLAFYQINRLSLHDKDFTGVRQAILLRRCEAFIDLFELFGAEGLRRLP